MFFLQKTDLICKLTNKLKHRNFGQERIIKFRSGFDFFSQVKSVFVPEKASSTISVFEKKLGCYQIRFRAQFISGKVFSQQTFEEIVNLHKKLLTLQLKTVQKRGSFIKELVKDWKHFIPM